MSNILYDTLPGSGQTVILDGASEVDYPEVRVVTTLGPVIAPKIYAQDLTSLQLASDGNISFTLDQEHNASLSITDNKVVFDTYDKPLRLETGIAPGTAIDMNSNIVVTAQNDISLTSSVDVSIVATENIDLTATKDVTITSQENVTLDVQKNLNLDVASTAHSITHSINNEPAIITDYHNGAVRTRIYNLETPGGVNPPTSESQTTSVNFDWGENEGETTIGGKYDDIIIDKHGDPRKRALVEPVWNFFGGAIGFNFVNASTGKTLRYHWRVNNKDELELIKMRYDEFGNNEICECAGKFGYMKAEPISDMVFGGGVVAIKTISSQQGASSPDAVATVSYESLHPTLAYNVHGVVTARGTVLASTQILDSPALVSSTQLQSTGVLTGNLAFFTVHEGGNLQSLTDYTVHMVVKDSEGNYGGLVTLNFTTVDTEDPVIGQFSFSNMATIDATQSNLSFNIDISDAAALATVQTLQSTTAGLTEQQVIDHADTVVTAISGTSYTATHELTTITQPLQQSVYNYLLVQDAEGNNYMQVVPLDPVTVTADGNAAADNYGIRPSDLTVSATNSEAMAVAVLDTAADGSQTLQTNVNDYDAQKTDGVISDTRTYVDATPPTISSFDVTQSETTYFFSINTGTTIADNVNGTLKIFLVMSENAGLDASSLNALIGTDGVNLQESAKNIAYSYTSRPTGVEIGGLLSTDKYHNGTGFDSIANGDPATLYAYLLVSDSNSSVFSINAGGAKTVEFRGVNTVLLEQLDIPGSWGSDANGLINDFFSFTGLGGTVLQSGAAISGSELNIPNGGGLWSLARGTGGSYGSTFAGMEFDWRQDGVTGNDGYVEFTMYQVNGGTSLDFTNTAFIQIRPDSIGTGVYIGERVGGVENTEHYTAPGLSVFQSEVNIKMILNQATGAVNIDVIDKGTSDVKFSRQVSLPTASEYAIRIVLNGTLTTSNRYLSNLKIYDTAP